MKVRMCVSIAGLAEPMYCLPEFSFMPGDEVELAPELAKAWIACGHAERIAKPRGARVAAAELPDAQPDAQPDEAQPQDAQGE